MAHDQTLTTLIIVGCASHHCNNITKSQPPNYASWTDFDNLWLPNFHPKVAVSEFMRLGFIRHVLGSPYTSPDLQTIQSHGPSAGEMISQVSFEAPRPLERTHILFPRVIC